MADSERHYSDAIVAFSETWTGIHYRGLAAFLQRLPIATVPAFSPLGPFDLAVLRSLRDVDGQTSIGGKQTFSAGSGHGGPCHVHSPEPGEADLLFLRGMPSTTWILDLGVKYHIDPEFFRRHLSFLQTQSSSPVYDLPARVSAVQASIQLQITTIRTREWPIRSSEVSRARKEEPSSLKEYHKILATRNTTGESIVRRYAVIDEFSVVLDQAVSISVKRSRDGGWTAIIWSDTGRPLRGSQVPGPWMRGHQPNRQQPDHCIPVIRHLKREALRDSILPEALRTEGVSGTTQSASVLSDIYGSSLDPRLARLDSLYALSEVFEIVIAAENQFANFINEKIGNILHLYKNREQDSLEALVHHKRLIDEHLDRSRPLLDLLEGRVYVKWPRCKEEDDRMLVDTRLRSLSLDLSGILSLLESVARRAVEGTTFIMNDSILSETKKRGAQQETVNRLTQLAFYFLPLSLVTSFFGMNFVELGSTGQLRIWIAFATAMPVLLVSCIICYWDMIILWIKDMMERLKTP